MGKTQPGVNAVMRAYAPMTHQVAATAVNNSQHEFWPCHPGADKLVQCHY